MSSPLSLATCVRVVGPEVHVRLEPQQALTLPHSDVFALALLLEPLVVQVVARPGRPWPRPVQGSLAQSVAANAGSVNAALAGLSGSWPRERALALARQHASCLGYRDPEGLVLPPGLIPRDDGVYSAAGWWCGEDERRAGQQKLSAAFDDWCTADMDHRARRGPPAPLPRPAITVVVAARQRDWVEHLEAGMCWDSYVFDDDAERAFP